MVIAGFRSHSVCEEEPSGHSRASEGDFRIRCVLYHKTEFENVATGMPSGTRQAAWGHFRKPPRKWGSSTGVARSAGELSRVLSE